MILSYFDVALCIIVCLIRRVLRNYKEVEKSTELKLPNLRRDFTVHELRHFDGNQSEGRVLLAVLGNVYDVTKARHLYGPGGHYASYAGRDVSRNLAKFCVTLNNNDELDDLRDLTETEMNILIEWDMQFKDKYKFVGKLLHEGEQPTYYGDDDEDADVCTFWI